MYFTKEGAAVTTDEVTEETTDATEEAEEVVEDTRTPIQKWWGGDWYGYMWVSSGTGNYAGFSNNCWDAMATLDVDENGVGNIRIWYDGLSRDNPVAEVTLDIQKDHGSGEMGAAFSESGWVFVNSDTGNGDVKHADWIIDPTLYDYEDLMVIDGSFVEGGGTMDYHFILRPWGRDWDDMVNSDDEYIPQYYDSWYLPLINDGYAMPENLLDEGTVKMDEKQTTASSSDSSNKDDADKDDKAETASNTKGGDGITDKDTLCRAYMWTKAYSTSHWDILFTYDAFVDYIGTEGFLKEEGATATDPTYYLWQTEDKSVLLTVGFKDKGKGKNIQTMSSVAISGVTEAEYTTFNPFEGRPAPTLDDSANITVNGVTFSMKMPKGRWYPAENAFGSYLFAAADEAGTSSATTRFQFSAGTSEEVFKNEQYFENIADAEGRTIAGIAMKGRSFKYNGYKVIEYSGEVNGNTVAIRLYDMTPFANSEFEAILDSITIK